MNQATYSTIASSSADRLRTGSRRTPTRPVSCRSARPRSARGTRRRTHSLRTVRIELAREDTEAAFKITSARRSSKFSCRNRLISSRSSALGRSGRCPSFASTCRRYLRNVSDGSPRSAATCAMPRLEHTRLARSNNSTGYFLDLGTTDLLPPDNPAIKDSAKPGTAHSVQIHPGCVLGIELPPSAAQPPRLSRWNQRAQELQLELAAYEHALRGRTAELD